MADTFYHMFFMGLVYTIEFLLIYVYGRKSFPKFSLWLYGGTWILMMVLSYSNGAWMGLAIIPGLVYLFILRKPNQTVSFKKLYAENNIYTPQKSILRLL